MNQNKYFMMTNPRDGWEWFMLMNRVRDNATSASKYADNEDKLLSLE
jgi:hypothetical protein